MYEKSYKTGSEESLCETFLVSGSGWNQLEIMQTILKL